MRLLKLLAALAAVVLVHLAGVWAWDDFPRAVDLFVVLVVLQALTSSSLAAFLGGMLIGLVHDTLTGGPYGLYGFADTIVGYLTARAAQRLIIDRASGVMAVAASAALVQQAIITGLAVLLIGNPTVPAVGWWGIKAATSAVAAALAFGAAEALQSTKERRRWDRRSKLRLGK